MRIHRFIGALAITWAWLGFAAGGCANILGIEADISEFAGQTVRIDVEIRAESNCMDALFDNFHVL